MLCISEIRWSYDDPVNPRSFSRIPAWSNETIPNNAHNYRRAFDENSKKCLYITESATTLLLILIHCVFGKFPFQYWIQQFCCCFSEQRCKREFAESEAMVVSIHWEIVFGISSRLLPTTALSSTWHNTQCRFQLTKQPINSKFGYDIGMPVFEDAMKAQYRWVAWYELF